MRRLVFCALAAFALGCGDDDDNGTGPTIDPVLVAGVYELQVLAFDPQGMLPEIDLLQRISESQVPQLIVTETQFQLVYRDPATGLVSTSNGDYTLTREGIRLNFPTAAEAQGMLLPQRALFTYDANLRALWFEQNTSVSLERFRQLAPEYEDEPLTNPVPGRLEVIFQVRTLAE